MSATRDDVVRLFGELDDAAIDRVLAVGASIEELREARGWIDGDEELEIALGEPTSARVSRVIDLVQAYVDDEELDEDTDLVT